MHEYYNLHKNLCLHRYLVVKNGNKNYKKYKVKQTFLKIRKTPAILASI